MKLAIDVHYNGDDYAIASGVLFKDWESAEVEAVVSVRVDEILPYQSGSFYKRELPCVLALLKKIKIEPEIIVIDGYVTLGDDQTDGLGAHLYKAIDSKIPIIGVAKNSFSGTGEKYQVFRGDSKKPLYITTAGMNLETAKNKIKSMHGKFRIPTILKRVDSECRQIVLP
ncbi:endonuclease V [Aliikangiella marina]|uniref:Endonuclease V n=1 Tax=Aliikangiella marina TaxID=1712262 RepID=A0A545T470_9GAMM|nr:endonuclease V [Aliikangiella marina]TQV71973.1 endonuclease V [Aliikangiella marina]TQV72026.1 endonuclease V [Aliikangiella marina]